MREPPSLADLAREPARIDEVPPKDAGRLLAELSSLALAVSARLVRPAEPEPAPPESHPAPPRGDRLLTAEEAALRLGIDVAAVTRRRWPFRVKLGRRTVRYSEAGLSEWLRREGAL